MQPTQIIGQVSIKELLQIHPQKDQKTKIHSNNYPCKGEMKLDTVKERRKINCVMCSWREKNTKKKILEWNP